MTSPVHLCGLARGCPQILVLMVRARDLALIFQIYQESLHVISVLDFSCSEVLSFALSWQFYSFHIYQHISFGYLLIYLYLRCVL